MAVFLTAPAPPPFRSQGANFPRVLLSWGRHGQNRVTRRVILATSDTQRQIARQDGENGTIVQPDRCGALVA